MCAQAVKGNPEYLPPMLNRYDFMLGPRSRPPQGYQGYCNMLD